MITVTITTVGEAKLYGMLVKKEVELRRRKQGTLHAKGGKKRNEAKWTHRTYDGWIRFKGSLGGAVVAVIRSKKWESEGDLLSSFVGFIHRHFHEEIIGINITYGGDA
jgi:hypothetical protein